MSELAPHVTILKTDGINCDEEMSHAFEVYGGLPETIHVNELRDGSRSLAGTQILAMPGGFSYGDDIASGRVLANELTSFLGDEIQAFVEAGKPFIGVCNGFQVAVKSGLLPYGQLGEQTVSLTDTNRGRLNCEWIELLPERGTVCKFVDLSDLESETIPMQEANGEGRFVALHGELERLTEAGQVVFRYQDNVNGSEGAVAAICDPSGLMLGIMPHPERSVSAFHPYRVRTETARRAAEVIFRSMINYAKEM